MTNRPTPREAVAFKGPKWQVAEFTLRNRRKTRQEENTKSNEYTRSHCPFSANMVLNEFI